MIFLAKVSKFIPIICVFVGIFSLLFSARLYPCVRGTIKKKGIILQRKIKFPKRINERAKASVFYGAANLFSRGIGFLFTPLFTRLLLPEEYGVYSLYTSLLGIFTVLISLEICGSISYKGMAKFNTGGTEEYASASFGVGAILYLGACAIYLAASKFIDGLTGLSPALTLILMTQVFFNTTLGIALSRARYEGKYRLVTTVSLTTGILTPLFSVLLILLGSGGYGRVISPLLTSGAAALLLALPTLKKSRKFYDKDIWKFIFGMAIPLLPHYLALSFIASGDKIIVSKLYGGAVLGKYSVACSLGLTPSLFAGGLTAALLPWVIKSLKAGRERVAAAVCERAVRAVCLMTLVFLTALPELYKIFAPSEYSTALPAAYAAAASVPFSFAVTLSTAALLSVKRPIVISLISLFSAAVGIGAGLLSEAFFSPYLTALLPIAAYLTLCVCDGAVGRDLFKRSGVNVNNYLLTLLLLISGVFLAFWLKSLPIARLLLFFALILTALGEFFRSRKLIMA